LGVRTSFVEATVHARGFTLCGGGRWATCRRGGRRWAEAGPRDLIDLACCRRRHIAELVTFDEDLVEAGARR